MSLPIPVIFRKLSVNDSEILLAFFASLSADTRQRFAPHPFDREGLLNYFRNHPGVFSIGGFNRQSGEMVCYAVIRQGYHEYEFSRFAGYGVRLSRQTDAMFAPVVADGLQGLGIGKMLFETICQMAKNCGIKRLILWGGVQAGNSVALGYYRKLGFVNAGFFLHEGVNEEMIFML